MKAKKKYSKIDFALPIQSPDNFKFSIFQFWRATHSSFRNIQLFSGAHIGIDAAHSLVIHVEIFRVNYDTLS